MEGMTSPLAGTPDLPTLVDTYLLRCAVEGKSPETLRAYRETLGRFLDALQEDAAPTDPCQLRADHVLAYLARFQHLSHDTRHRYFREVRCFFNWLRAADYADNDPFRGLRNVRLPQKIVPPFTAQDIHTLLAVCNGGTPVGGRDRALILTLLDTGIRCAELVALDWGDCDFGARRLHIRHGKGDKARVVPFATRCAEALATYLFDRGTDPGPFFLSARYGRLHPGVRLGVNGVKVRLRALGRESGIPKVHAHRFRHTFATWAIAQDARELDVQHLLGHSSPDMVRRYSATYRSEQAAVRHAAFSPADRLASV